MDAITVIGATLRRWYVSLPLALATIATVLVVSSSFPQQFRSSTTVLVVGPSQVLVGGTPQQVNPFVTISDSAKIVALAVANVGMSEPVRESLRNQGFAADYSLRVQPATSFIDVTVTDDDRQLAERTMDGLLASASGVTSNLQKDVLPQLQLRVVTLRDPTTAMVDPANSTQFLLLIGGLGAVVTIGAAVGADLLLKRRRRRAALPGPPTPTADSTIDPIAGPIAGPAAGPAAGGVPARPRVPGATPTTGPDLVADPTDPTDPPRLPVVAGPLGDGTGAAADSHRDGPARVGSGPPA